MLDDVPPLALPRRFDGDVNIDPAGDDATDEIDRDDEAASREENRLELLLLTVDAPLGPEEILVPPLTALLPFGGAESV